MPTYAYKCYDCGAEFEVSQKMSDDPIKCCESCGGENVKRQLFASPFQLKGTGWYKTDYAGSSSSASSSKISKGATKENGSSSECCAGCDKKETCSATNSTSSVTN